MNLIDLGANQSVLVVKGKTVLFSYGTPVAASIDGVEYKNEEYFSVTTSSHVKAFLISFDNANSKPQEWFNNLLK